MSNPNFPPSEGQPTAERPEVARMLDEDIGPGFWESLEAQRKFEEAWGDLGEEEE